MQHQNIVRLYQTQHKFTAICITEYKPIDHVEY